MIKVLPQIFSMKTVENPGSIEISDTIDKGARRNVSRESRWRSNISSWCFFVIWKARSRLVGNCFHGWLEVLLFHFSPACCRLRTAIVNARLLYQPHQKVSIYYGTVPESTYIWFQKFLSDNFKSHDWTVGVGTWVQKLRLSLLMIRAKTHKYDCLC